MCGRYVSPAQADIEREWSLHPAGVAPFKARYNVAPQQGNPKNYIPVVRQAEDGAVELAKMQWWLLPSWSKEFRVKFSTFNARVETVDRAASFREPLRRRRCLIPAKGWYEWQELPSGNRPWYPHAADGSLLAFAGVWEHWQHGDEVVES